MLNEGAISKIVELARYEVKKIGDVEFFVGAQGAEALEYPKLQAVHLFGLSQFLNFIEVSAEKFGAVYVNVLNETRVQLIDRVTGKNLEVVVHAEADFSKTYKPFESGRQYNQEDFIVELMSKFESDDASKSLITLVSRVIAGKTTELADDGISQEVTVKSGVSLVKSETLKNIWSLRPFRTFMEIEQPDSTFVLRAKAGGSGNPPMFALFLADGKMWRPNAVQAIKEWLKGKGVTLPIIA